MESLGYNELTHCGLVTPYSDLDVGQLWLRYGPVAWRHQPITSTECWLIIKGILCYSLESNFTSPHKNPKHVFWDSTFKITTTSPSHQEIMGKIQIPEGTRPLSTSIPQFSGINMLRCASVWWIKACFKYPVRLCVRNIQYIWYVHFMICFVVVI